MNITLQTTVCAQLLSRVQLFATPWTIAQRAPLSVGFSRQEYWSVMPFPTLGYKSTIPNIFFKKKYYHRTRDYIHRR